jgi:hypothetical protein
MTTEMTTEMTTLRAGGPAGAVGLPQAMWKSLWIRCASASPSEPSPECTGTCATVTTAPRSARCRSRAAAFLSAPRFAFLFAIVLGAFVLLPLTVSSAAAQSAGAAAGAAGVDPIGVATIDIDEIERGQTGYGLSVFSGSTPERFEVEVIGVLRDFRPGMSYVLAHLSGQGLEESGVVAGMSGSPVYVDGRLAGAVAFSWNFSTGAIAGITPIADMRSLSALARGAESARPSSRLGLMSTVRLLLEPQLPHHLLDEQLELLRSRVPLEGASSTLQFSATGYQGAARDLLAQAFGNVAPSGRASDQLELPPLQPGSAVTAVLVGGDLSISVTGTVTDLDGEQLVAFGHPIYGLGPVRVPMAKAEVLTVVPSRFSSFKVSNVGEVIGAVDQDRIAGVRGLIGVEAPTASLSIALERATPSGEREQIASYDLELADVPLLRPTLSAVTLLQALERAAYASGEQSIDFEGTFEIAGYPPLVMRQVFSGPNAGMDAAIQVLSVVGFLELNEWEDVDVEAMKIALVQHDGSRLATVTGVHADRRQVRPGERVVVHCDLRAQDGSTRAERIEVTIPDDTPPGPYYLFVGDAATIDGVRQQIEPTEPTSFGQALEVLRGFSPRDQLAVLGARAARGLVVSGQAMPDLPDSMRSIWGAASPAQVKPLSLAIEQYQLEAVGLPLQGAERIDLTVLERGIAGAAQE